MAGCVSSSVLSSVLTLLMWRRARLVQFPSDNQINFTQSRGSRELRVFNNRRKDFCGVREVKQGNNYLQFLLLTFGFSLNLSHNNNNPSNNTWSLAVVRNVSIGPLPSSGNNFVIWETLPPELVGNVENWYWDKKNWSKTITWEQDDSSWETWAAWAPRWGTTIHQ